MTNFFFNDHDQFGKVVDKADFGGSVLAVWNLIQGALEALVGAHRKAWRERRSSQFARCSCTGAQFILAPEVLPGARLADLAPREPARQPAILDSTINGSRFHRIGPLLALRSYVLEPVKDRRRVGRSTTRAGRPNIDALPLHPGAML